MIKLRPLALMLVRFFKSTFFITLILSNIFIINISLVYADEKSKKTIKNNNLKNSFGAAVIDMQKVLAKSTAWSSLQKQVKEIVNNTAKLVELGRKVRDDEIIINPDYAYPAYGVPSNETNEAIRLAARTEAMITDPVYEGKSMQGMIDLAKKGFFPKGSKILYAHLGGAPAINGYSYTYRNG